MSDRTLKVRIEGSAKGLVSAAKEGDKALDGLESTVQSTGKQLDGMAKKADKAEKEVDALGKEAKDSGRQVKELGREADKTEKEIDALGREALSSSGELEKFGRGADKAERSAARLGRTSKGLNATGKAMTMGGNLLVNQYTAMAGGLGAAATVIQSAKLDKSLTGIRLTAGEARKEAVLLRKELFRMSQETGAPVEDLAAGFNSLVQSGQSWKASLQQIDAINKGAAISSATPDQLASSLSVASNAFQFDLSKPGLALDLLDKMVVAGGQGSAELEDLSNIFARVGTTAASAGFSFDKTLAFIEALSAQEKNPERLATLADSTVRLFNNMNYLKDASKATGVRFFDPSGNRRDVLEIFGDLRKQFRKLETDQQRAKWMQKAFGKADLDTQRGLRILMQGNTLEQMGAFEKQIGKAQGTTAARIADATGNAVDQAGRLKNTLREAADGFAKPINDTFSRGVQWLLKSKAEGGSGLSGQQLLLGGGAMLGGAALMGKFGGGMLAKMGGGATGLAMGKALEHAAGVTPVFVVNMPGSGIPGASEAGSTTAAAAAANAGGQAARRGLLARAGGLISTYTPSWIKTVGGGSLSLGRGLARSGKELFVDGWGDIAGRWAYQRGLQNRLPALAGSALKLGKSAVGGSVVGTLATLPFEYAANGFNMRSTVGAVGAGIGGNFGGKLGLLGGGGLASVPLSAAGGIGGSMAGHELAVSLYDYLTGAGQNLQKAAAQGNAASKLNPGLNPFQPTFQIYNQVDSQGRATTRVEGPGATGFNVFSSPLSPGWVR